MRIYIVRNAITNAVYETERIISDIPRTFNDIPHAINGGTGCMSRRFDGRMLCFPCCEQAPHGAREGGRRGRRARERSVPTPWPC